MAKIAKSAASIDPFHVMRLLERARELEGQGERMIHMEIGEPDFPLAEPVTLALQDAIQTVDLGYTPALGLPGLRRAIADTYDDNVTANNIVVTPGSSGAIQLALACILDPGDDVLLPDPGYPCNRHIVSILGGNSVALSVGRESSFQPTTEQIRASWTENTAVLMLASPANPTGSLLLGPDVREIIDAVGELGGCLIMDEIYAALTYEPQPPSAAGLADHVFVVNSFSKYHGLTGLRTGWLVAPEQYMSAAEKLAQNLFLSASTIGQYGCLAALSEQASHIFEKRKKTFKARLDYLLHELPKLGFIVPVKPSGAFYIYADCSRLTDDSFAFCHDLLEQAGVVITPGKDFGANQPEKYVRFSCTSDLSQLEEGVSRLRSFLSAS